MKNPNSPKNRRRSRMVLVTSATALVATLAIAPPQAAASEGVTGPPVPADLQVPDGHEAFLIGHAYGTQNYICLRSGSRVKWTLFGPQATLFDDDGGQITTHFLSPNPAEGGAPRATWQHSRDTSAVWALAIASSLDSDFVAPGAIPWLLLRIVGAQYGPGRGDELTATTFIQRVNTAGGIAPATGCTLPTDVGNKVLVPYAADYVFYTQ